MATGLLSVRVTCEKKKKVLMFELEKVLGGGVAIRKKEVIPSTAYSNQQCR